MQLVNDCVVMYDTMKDKRIGIPEVIEKFGVPPDKVIEVQALIGDSTDNVPGVPGIGVKTAAQLIVEYGDLETLLQRASEIKQDKRRQTLIDNAELARISKRLVTLDQHVELDVPVADLAVHEPDGKLLVAFLKAMEFNTLTRRVAEKSGIEANEIEANAKVASSGERTPSPRYRQAGAADPRQRRPVRAAAQAAQQGRTRPEPEPGGACRNAARCRQSQQDRPRQIRKRAHAGSVESLDAAHRGCRGGCDQDRNHRRRSDDSAAVRRCARGRRQRGLLCADRPSRGWPAERQRPVRSRGQAVRRPDRGKRCPRCAPAGAGKSIDPEGRPESQIRLADLFSPGHRDFSLRRHHPDVLRARRRPQQPRRLRPGPELARPPDHPAGAGHRHRQGASAVRLRADREGVRVRGRAGRRHPAAVEGAEGAARRRARRHRL